MNHNPVLVNSFEQRLSLVEPLRRRARSTWWLKLSGYLSLGLVFLGLLGGGAVGTLWFIGNFVTKNLLIAFGGMIAVVVVVGAVGILAFKRFSRWRHDEEQQYIRAFRRDAVVPALREAFPGCTITVEGIIDAEIFDASGLFSRDHNRFESSYGIAGNLRGAGFRGSMVWAKRAMGTTVNQRAPDVTHFKGIVIHLDAQHGFPGTLRLVEAHRYQGGDRPQWGVLRRGRTERAQGLIEAFDSEAAAVVDEGQIPTSPLPEAVGNAWVAMRKLLNPHPLFVSFSPSGIYVALPTRISARMPLEESLQLPNDPRQLAEETDLLLRVVQAAGYLRALAK